MGFEIAINYNFAKDNGEVLNSVKAAYLYADKVRVYDWFSDDSFALNLGDECNRKVLKKYLNYSSQVHKMPETDKDSFDDCYLEKASVADILNQLGNISDELSKNLDISDFPEYTDFVSYICICASQLEFSTRRNEFFRKTGLTFQTAFDQMGIDIKKYSINTSYDEKPAINSLGEFINQFKEDKGYKLANDCFSHSINPEALASLITPTNLSEHVLSTLPGFEEATIDEIIDIRKELNKHIIPYRSAILKMSEEIKGVHDAESLQFECQRIYHQKIEPEVARINAAIHDNNVFRNIAKTVATDGKIWTAAAGLASVIAATGTVISPLSIGTTVTFGTLAIGGGVMKTLEKESTLKENEMFFLYEAGNKLKRRKL